MPLQATSGAASYDAFGGGAAAVPNYIEEVFQTWLYTGNGTSQTITNGIDLAGKGGLVWIKPRNAAQDHVLSDSQRGISNVLYTNSASAQDNYGSVGISSFNSNGFGIGNSSLHNENNRTYASWTFREQPKFFDVVTYTGNGSSLRAIAHNLGSVPGCVIIKGTSSVTNWRVYHRSLGISQQVVLNATDAADSSGSLFGSPPTAPTDTNFYVGNDSESNGSGQTYVAYLFAHNAGGFGTSGNDNVISCGSFTASSGAATVNLGYEPQWVLYKRTDDADNWKTTDNMRGMFASFAGSNGRLLYPNLSNAEAAAAGAPFVNATGFYFDGVNNGPGSASGTYIYIAIRRGPMKVPTTGTSVYNAIARTGNGAVTTVTGVGFTPDFLINANRTRNVSSFSPVQSRLQGAGVHMYTSLTNPEATDTNGIRGWDVMNGIQFGNDSTSGAWNWSGAPYINWFFGRASGFFDEVCYNGNSSTQTVTHNLAAVPELMIVKIRNGVSGWPVYSSAVGNTKLLRLNTTSAESVDNVWANTTPTASSFTVGNNGDVNQSGGTYVAYLFASCPGVSKVTNFTGTGALQTINCGFTSGARFVLIKRTDSTGNWFVWDSSRGLSSSNDPYLLLNSTAAEVTTTNWVDTTSTGFQVTAASGNDVNISGASYIALAIS